MTRVAQKAFLVRIGGIISDNIISALIVRIGGVFDTRGRSARDKSKSCGSGGGRVCVGGKFWLANSEPFSKDQAAGEYDQNDQN